MIDEKDIRITMRDGVKLSVRVYRPDAPGRYPALFAASPYRYDNNELPAQPSFLWRETGPIEWYVDQGYAYVHLDVRGTGASEGRYGFLDRAEQEDLYEVIEWIAAQPWCSGRVGGIGQSYYAMSQWFMGIQNPPHLACLGIYDGLIDPYRYMAYPGGIEGNFLYYWLNASVRVANLYPANGHAPRQIPDDLLLGMQQHPLYDDFWKERSAIEQLHKIQVPVYSIGVWAKQDLHLDGNIRGWQLLKSPKKLAITPTPTPFSSATDFADIDFHRQYLLPFYEHHLQGRDSGYAQRPPVEYTLRNTGIRRVFDCWPPRDTKEQVYYLGAGPSGAVASLNDGSLRIDPPQAASAHVAYSYPDPSWVLGVVPVGPQGPRPVAGVLTFTSDPLGADLEIAGNVLALIHASSTRDDMDFIVKLSEQFPGEAGTPPSSPRSVIVTKGWLRASHAQPDPVHSTPGAPYYTHAERQPLKPGRSYEIAISLQPIAHIFRKGSRLRFELSCGDSPVTDGLFFHVYRPDKIGTDTIHFDTARPSRVVLPVLPSA